MSWFGNVIKGVGDFFTGGLYSDVMDQFTGASAQQMQDSANQTNLQIARETNQTNVDLWREQMEYNSPENQMARLKDAGLNPQLAYGNVNQVAAASSPPQMQRAEVSPYLGSPQLMQQLLQFGLGIPEMQKINAEVNLINENARALETQIKGYKLDNTLKALQGRHSRFDLNLKQDLRHYQLESAKYDVDKQKVDIELGKQQLSLNVMQHLLTGEQIKKLFEETQHIRSLRTEQDAKNKLWKAGINPNATGMDLLVGQMYKNPKAFVEQLKLLFDTSLDSLSGKNKFSFNKNFDLSDIAKNIFSFGRNKYDKYRSSGDTLYLK